MRQQCTVQFHRLREPAEEEEEAARLGRVQRLMVKWDKGFYGFKKFLTASNGDFIC